MKANCETTINTKVQETEDKSAKLQKQKQRPEKGSPDGIGVCSCIEVSTRHGHVGDISKPHKTRAVRQIVQAKVCDGRAVPTRRRRARHLAN